MKINLYKRHSYHLGNYQGAKWSLSPVKAGIARDGDLITREWTDSESVAIEVKDGSEVAESKDGELLLFEPGSSWGKTAAQLAAARYLA